MWDSVFTGLKGLFGEQGLALLALLGIGATVIWIVYVFFSEGTRYAAQQYYDLKNRLCVDAAKSTAQMATSRNADTIRVAAVRFEELYWGELVLVEDATLERAMVEFRGIIADPASRELEIEKVLAMGNRAALRTAALNISRACFNMLQPNWLDQLKSTFRTPRKR